jgi:hypothetical protein
MTSDTLMLLDIRRRCGAMLSELDKSNYYEAASRMSMVVDTLDKLVEQKVLSRTPSRDEWSSRSQSESRSE